MSTERIDTGRNPIFLAGFRRYVRWRISRTFDGLWVEGLDRTRRLARRDPLVFVSNHVAFWDPLVVVAIDEALGTEGYALMDAHNLGKLPFFRWVGAVPIDRTSPSSSRRGFKVGAALCQAPGRALWVFAQGRPRPAHLRPLDIKPGVRLLARLSEASVVPVALQYLFREGEQPGIFVSLGEPLSWETVASKDGPGAVEEAVAAGLARVDRFAEHGEGSFEALIEPERRRIDEGLGARLLAEMQAFALGRRKDAP